MMKRRIPTLGMKSIQTPTIEQVTPITKQIINPFTRVPQPKVDASFAACKMLPFSLGPSVPLKTDLSLSMTFNALAERSKSGVMIGCLIYVASR